MSMCTPVVPRIHETSEADVGYGHHNQKAARILLILLPAPVTTTRGYPAIVEYTQNNHVLVLN